MLADGRLTVLNVAYPLAPVGREAAGGAEQIVAILDSRLCRAGHRSIVIACVGSEVAGIFEPTPAFDGELNDRVKGLAHRSHQLAIACALRRWNIDIVQLHGLDCLDYLPSEPVHTLITLHLPLGWYPPSLFDLRSKKLGIIGAFTTGLRNSMKSDP